MQIEIPGYQTLTINHLLLDYNGTIAEDGRIRDRVRELLIQLSESLTIHVLTADTHGTAAAECQSIPLLLDTFPTSDAASYKLQKLQETGASCCACIGNGRNDLFMLKEAALFHRGHRPGGYVSAPPALLRSVCALLRGSAGALSSSETDHRRTTWIRQPRG